MMFALIADVINHRFTLGTTHRKRAIARLPRKAAVGFGVGPFGGIALDAAHHFGNGNRVRHSSENVDVIGRAIDDERVAAFAVDDSGYVLVKILLAGLSDERLPEFGGKHNVKQNVGEG